MTAEPATTWQVLAVDDEPLGLAELVHLVGQDARVATVTSARDGLEALRQLRDRNFDLVFLDVNMPGLDGVELAGVLRGQAKRPLVVFVTAHEGRAAEAYDLDAVDYVLKPLRPERITEALDRVERRIASRPNAGGSGSASDSDSRSDDDMAMVRIDDGRRTFYIHRDDVLYAEAHRDYVHLHTRGTEAGVHAVRVPLSELEAKWSEHGFLRIHRSFLIALRFVTEVARDPLGGQLVRVAGHDLPVSRRQAGVLRDRVQALSRRGATSRRVT